MVGDSVAHLRESGQQVFIDAEHFFDGYRLDRVYALEVLTAAFEAGAEAVALCDNNGGMISPWVGEIGSEVLAETGGRGSGRAKCRGRVCVYVYVDGGGSKLEHTHSD